MNNQDQAGGEREANCCICLKCKRYWINRPYGCVCGSKSFDKTHPSNASKAEDLWTEYCDLRQRVGLNAKDIPTDVKELATIAIRAKHDTCFEDRIIPAFTEQMFHELAEESFIQGYQTALTTLQGEVEKLRNAFETMGKAIVMQSNEAIIGAFRTEYIPTHVVIEAFKALGFDVEEPKPNF